LIVDATLLLLADGRFPSGGHAYSAGVESAVAHGDVIDIPTLDRFLAGRLATTGLVDAAFACRSSAGSPPSILAELDREYDARLPSPRARSVSRQLGRQLLRAASEIWPSCRRWDGAHHAIALGSVVETAGGTPADAVAITIHQLASAVTTAAVRLLGLDPVTVAALQARHVASVDHASFVAEWSRADPRDLPAGSGTLSEILAEHHSGWSHRLFVG
jgi:urease accessory protein